MRADAEQEGSIRGMLVEVKKEEAAAMKTFYRAVARVAQLAQDLIENPEPGLEAMLDEVEEDIQRELTASTAAVGVLQEQDDGRDSVPSDIDLDSDSDIDVGRDNGRDSVGPDSEPDVGCLECFATCSGKCTCRCHQ